MDKPHSRAGFTLIELLIVIAIIGILASILIPNLVGSRKAGFDAAATHCSTQLQQAQADRIGNHQTFADSLAHLPPNMAPACTGGNDAIQISATYPSGVQAAGAGDMRADGRDWCAYVWSQRGKSVMVVNATHVLTASGVTSGASCPYSAATVP